MLPRTGFSFLLKFARINDVFSNSRQKKGYRPLTIPTEQLLVSLNLTSTVTIVSGRKKQKYNYTESIPIVEDRSTIVARDEKVGNRGQKEEELLKVQ